MNISNEKDLRILFVQGTLTWDYKFILRALRGEGTIERDADIVLVLTGHVLKDGAYAAAYHASGAAYANHIVDARGEGALRALLERAVPAHA